MAAGDRKVKVTHIHIARANPVIYVALWQLFIENRLGTDVYAADGSHRGSFGTAAAWRLLTGAQMETQVTSDVTAAVTTPPRDSVS